MLLVDYGLNRSGIVQSNMNLLVFHSMIRKNIRFQIYNKVFQRLLIMEQQGCSSQ